MTYRQAEEKVFTMILLVLTTLGSPALADEQIAFKEG
jgi:hypothetical protein